MPTDVGMPLRRRIRRTGGSLSVGIPAHLADQANLGEGDELEWEVVDRDVWRLRRVEAPR